MTTAREAITEAYKAFEEAFYKGEADTISRTSPMLESANSEGITICPPTRSA